MRDQIMQFLKEIDNQLRETTKPGERLDLYLIGRSSLVLRLDLTSVFTNDVDIIWMSTTSPSGESLEDMAIRLFGQGTPNALRLDLFLERVPQGTPPVPHHFRKRSIEIEGEWQVIRPKVLEFHDFAVTKLKRFAAKDREDLKLLCDRQLITPQGLTDSLENAFAFAADEEEDPDRKKAYDAYRKVCAYLETGKPTF
jgi:hypothetical protein